MTNETEHFDSLSKSLAMVYPDHIISAKLLGIVFRVNKILTEKKDFSIQDAKDLQKELEKEADIAFCENLAEFNTSTVLLVGKF